MPIIVKTIKKMWVWIKKNWWWLKWIGLTVAAILGYKILAVKGSKIVSAITGRKVNWMTIPGSPDNVLIRNPDTGVPEVVLLPRGVTSKEIISAAKGRVGKYEITIRHTAVDRRNATGDGNALDSLGL